MRKRPICERLFSLERRHAHEFLHIDDDVQPDMSRRGEQMVQLRVPTGKRNHIIDIQKRHGKILFVRILPAFRVHGGLFYGGAQSVQARIKRVFPRVVGVNPFVTQAFRDHLLHFRKRAVRLDGARDDVPPIAQREELPPYDETRGRLSLPRIPEHGRMHGEGVKLDVLGLPITVGTLEGLYFKSYI